MTLKPHTKDFEHIVTFSWAGGAASTYWVLHLIYLSPDDAYIIRGVRDETLIRQVLL